MTARNTGKTKLPYLRLAFKLSYRGSRQADARHADVVADSNRIFFGPLMRRRIGAELADVACSMPPPICRRRATTRGAEEKSGCAQAESCAFGVLFAKSRSSYVEGGINMPSPFSVYVPAVKSLEALTEMEIILYGAGRPFYLAMIQACARALAAGIGQSRSCYEVQSVSKVRADGIHEPLCERNLATMDRNATPEDLSAILHANGNDKSVMMELLSPTRLLVDSKLLKGDMPISFSSIINSILGRLRDHFGQEAESLLPGGSAATLMEQAEEVTLMNSDVRWIDIPDDSGSKRTGRLLGGKVGRIAFNAPAGQFLPLLRAGEILHIGKNSASGCGRIAIIEPGTK